MGWVNTSENRSVLALPHYGVTLVDGKVTIQWNEKHDVFTWFAMYFEKAEKCWTLCRHRLTAIIASK